MKFDGVDDYIEAPHNTNLNPTEISVEAWVKTNIADKNAVIVGKFNHTSMVGYVLFQHPSQQFTWWIYGDGNYAYSNGSGALTVGTWYHVVGTYSSPTLKLYINGSLVDTDTKTVFGSSTDNLRIGQRTDGSAGSGYAMDGSIDGVRIYNRALSAEEIRYHYNRGGPMAYWKFNEGEGTTAYDSTDNNNDGTLGGGTAAYQPTWVEGKFGSALSFDGTDDYVNVPHSSSLVSIRNYTIMAWVKRASGQPDSVGWVVGKYWYFYLGVLNDGRIQNRYVDPSLTWRTFTSTGTIPVDTWSHIVAEIIENGDNSTAKIFINSVEESTSLLNYPTTSTNPLRLGAFSATTERYKGTIDDVRIYNYARTQEQILQDYNAGLGIYFK